MSEETADEAPNSQPASRWRRAAERVEMGLSLFFVSVCYGAGYGAAFGAFCGAIFGILSPMIEPMGGLVGGALLFGAPCGAIGGGVFAVVGCMLGGRTGWILAGLLGGTVFPVSYWCLAAGKEGWDRFVILVSVTSVLLGGFLGRALNQELRGGISAVPGMQNIASLIREWHGISEGDGGEAGPAEG